MKREFCNADFDRCARYRVFNELGKGYAPEDMTPVDQEQADQIIARGEAKAQTSAHSARA